MLPFPAAMSESEPVNFRARTGRLRRARTRASILSAALEVFDTKGIGLATVEDVRERAGLARGSFYNYFQTYEGMLKELAAEIARQLNAEQSERFEDLRIWPSACGAMSAISFCACHRTAHVQRCWFA